VIRTGDRPKLAEFYTLLGLHFEYHKHGNSPMHYSAKAGETTIEIYPLAKGQSSADNNLRLGFVVDNFDAVVALLNDNIISQPLQTEWGYMMIVQDPDGRKIEIYKK
jgi:lactoylglutathione lyase